MAVAFGTSGLRGPAEDFTPALCDAFVSAFLERSAGMTTARTVYLAGDLRDSTPSIAASCLSAARSAGWQAVWAGNVPTPALACYALERKAPAIMITGSHIPETYNGIKFYRPDGEFLKEDEAPVKTRADAIMAERRSVAAQPMGTPDAAIAEAYVQRYLSAFGAGALSGIEIGVDLHSAVGRDLMVRILEGLGARCVAFRRSGRFIAVDTEALDPDDVARAGQVISEHGLDGVVSTDGDGDRPLVIDEKGRQINGDVLGTLTARALNIASVVTPLSSTSAIEQSGWFAHVTRTRIGSPFVVAAMIEAGLHPVAGFEANGGFLLQDDLVLEHGQLKRLPTRDAMLPVIAVLAEVKRRGLSLSQLAAELPARTMLADRLKNVAPEKAGAFLDAIQASRQFRADFDPRIANPVDINRLDGVRMTFADGSTVHFRQSGNAPELRCYVETSARIETETRLAGLMTLLARHFTTTGDLNG